MLRVKVEEDVGDAPLACHQRLVEKIAAACAYVLQDPFLNGWGRSAPAKPTPLFSNRL